MKIRPWKITLISTLLIVSISCQMTDLLPSSGPNADNFTAKATSPISVQLTWSHVDGAQKYLIERNDGGTDTFSIAEVSGDTTSFEDFLVPANTSLTYRIKTVTASVTSGGKTVSLTTPTEQPNPLTVQATFADKQAKRQAVGPGGGSLSTTDSKGVRYTLAIPAGALDFEVNFVLTPVQKIQGFPLSGGMTSGVRIEPEGIAFNQPATLTMQSSQPAPSNGMASIAFAFDQAGNEFHFVPSRPGPAADSNGGLIMVGTANKMETIDVQRTKSYGDGNGTPQDVRNQAENHASSNAADNMNQELAAGNEENLLTPLAPTDAVTQMFMKDDAQIIDQGLAIQHQATQTDWQSFNTSVDAFQAWLNNWDRTATSYHRDEINKIEDDIWNSLSKEAKDLLDKAATDCEKSSHLGAAKKLVNQLLNGVSKFAQRFNQQFGENTLKDIKAKLDKCYASYRATSSIGFWDMVICSLDQPFSGTFQSNGAVWHLYYFPVDSQNGSYTADLTVPGGSGKGSGTYTVTLKTDHTGTMTFNGSFDITTVVGTTHTNQSYTYDLTPLPGPGCNQP